MPVVLGSRSTYALGALGGFKGRKLEVGDELPVGKGRSGRRGGARGRQRSRRPAGRRADGIAGHAGAVLARITEAAGNGFFADTWKVAPEADRIGYRFKGGKPLEFVPREPPFGAGSDPIPRISPMPATPMARSRSWWDRANRAASRRSLGRRLFHGRHRDLRGYGSDRSPPAEYAGAVRQGRHGSGTCGPKRPCGSAGQASQRAGVTGRREIRRDQQAQLSPFGPGLLELSMRHRRVWSAFDDAKSCC